MAIDDPRSIGPQSWLGRRALRESFARVTSRLPAPILRAAAWFRTAAWFREGLCYGSQAWARSTRVQRSLVCLAAVASAAAILRLLGGEAPVWWVRVAELAYQLGLIAILGCIGLVVRGGRERVVEHVVAGHQDSTWETAARMLAGSTRHLRASEARFRAILASVVDPLLVLDEGGAIIEVSRSSEVIFHLCKQELMGKKFEDLADPRWLARSRANLDAALGQASVDAVAEFEMCCLRANGESFCCGISVARGETKLVGSVLFVASLRDLTVERELQRQVVHAQKMRAIGQLSSGVAHELNTPVQFIGDNLRFLQESVLSLEELLRGYRDLAARNASRLASTSELEKLEAQCADADVAFLEEEIPEAIRQSLAGAERVGEIVRAMREFSQYGDIKFAEVDVNRAVEATTIVSQSEWRRVADLELRLDPSSPVVVGVGSELNQVFLNLLLNACQAIQAARTAESPDNGRICVETFVEERFVGIRFVDNGVGIPPEVGERVFEPFYTTRGVGEGPGQGLAIAHQVIVERHAGRISVESEPGVRTVFTVRLPRAETNAVKLDVSEPS